MSSSVRVQPDLKFVKELQQVGGESLKKCYQCATCSVVCPLSPADGPYPRKEMVWAQWGLKDKLLNDIDIWLCHNCGTCSDLCPRGAKPADLLAAMRNMAYRNVAEPSIIGKWMSSSKGLPFLIAIPAILWMAIWIVRAGALGSMFPLFEAGEHGWIASAAGSVVYGGLFPGDYTIDPIFAITFFAMVFVFWRATRKLLASFADQPKTFVVGGGELPCFCSAVVDTLVNEVGQHTTFNDCGEEEEDTQRFKGHIVLMYAFVALAIVTGTIAVCHWGSFLLNAVGLNGIVTEFIHYMGSTPLSLINPIKLLANAGAIGMLFGLTLLTRRRSGQDPAKKGSSWYDWYLLGLLWVIVLTGVGAELFRLLGLAVLGYPTYYVHLVAVWMLFAYLPWSKLGHLVYRTASLAYAKKIGRIPMGRRCGL